MSDIFPEKPITSLPEAVAFMGALPMSVGPKPQSPDSFPPALPWARLMDREDLADFLDELAAAAITHASSDVALAGVESTIARWRLIADAQHGHNTAPGPDAVTQSFAPVAALPEALSREEPHDSPLHQDHRIPHDLQVPKSCRLDADQVDEVSRRFIGGGA